MNATKQADSQPATQQHQATSVATASPRAFAQAQRLGNGNLDRLLRARLLQAKLTVSNPHDVYEQEADRVADQVMRMPEPEAQVAAHSGPTAAVPTVDAATENSIGSLSSRGSALPESVRSFMEPRFNADFSAVRVHTDAHAHELARTVNAQAFTVGRNVVFGSGYYAPQTDSGKRLLAHELAHVMQQSGAGEIRRQPIRADDATIQVSHPAPPAVFVRPASVVEMKDALEEAENLLVDPALLRRQERIKLYGTATLPHDWKPDVAGALLRIDAVLDFVRPLVDADSIKRHGAESLTPNNVSPGNLTRENVKATALGLYYTTDWLKKAADSFEEVRRLRSQPGIAPSELAAKARSLLAFRAASPLKILADEGLSFELDLGSSPRPAPEFRSQMRSQLPGGSDLSKRELRVLAWLRDNKDIILAAESAFRVDRRAIAATIAWEAMENIMRGSPHSAGPGKMHTYSNDWVAVAPFLPKGDALPQQVEDAGLVPKPKSDEDREAIFRMPKGAVTYIAAAMRGAADSAAQYGYDISHDLVALTSFYQGHDLPSWKKHMEHKRSKGEKTFVAADTMALWTQSHIGYLESVLGQPPK